MIRERDLVFDETGEDETIELRTARPCVDCRKPTTGVVRNWGTIRGWSPLCPTGH